MVEPDEKLERLNALFRQVRPLRKIEKKNLDVEDIRKVALYLRVSTEEQAEEGLSIPTQKETLTRFAEEREWKVVGVYPDEGYSGKSEDRPAYKRMMEQDGKWDAVLVTKLDRVHRKISNFVNWLDKLREKEKGFVSFSEFFDTNSAFGQAILSFIAMMAQLERELTSERTSLVMEHKAKGGAGIMGGSAPIGYYHHCKICNGICRVKKKADRKRHKRQLRIDKTKAPIVRRIFKEYAAGDRSISAIVKRLNKDKLTTARGGRFVGVAVAWILSNPIYAGFVGWAKVLAPIEDTRYEGPIISLPLWRTVLVRMASEGVVATAKRPKKAG